MSAVCTERPFFAAAPQLTGQGSSNMKYINTFTDRLLASAQVLTVTLDIADICLELSTSVIDVRCPNSEIHFIHEYSFVRTSIAVQAIEYICKKHQVRLQSLETLGICAGMRMQTRFGEMQEGAAGGPRARERDCTGECQRK